MRKTRPFLLLVLVGWLGATIAALVLFLPPRPSIDKESFQQIRLGMTQPEVEAVLGAPPGHHCRLTPFYKVQWTPGNPAGSRQEFWQTDKLWIGVLFDRDEKAIYKEMVDLPARSLSRREWLRSLLPF